MSKRILVVEDQPDNRQIIRDMLAPTDYECVFADINADHGNCAVEALGHGVLLCLWRPLPDVAGGAGARPDHSISGH
jgi:CheY-like chemotaxis protein